MYIHLFAFPLIRTSLKPWSVHSIPSLIWHLLLGSKIGISPIYLPRVPLILHISHSRMGIYQHWNFAILICPLVYFFFKFSPLRASVKFCGIFEVWKPFFFFKRIASILWLYAFCWCSNHFFRVSIFSGLKLRKVK